MSDDRKRTYQSVTPLPSLRTHIAVPPLKMVLVNDLQGDESKPAANQIGGSNNALDVPATKERIVRKIIQHLEKEP